MMYLRINIYLCAAKVDAMHFIAEPAVIYNMTIQNVGSSSLTVQWIVDNITDWSFAQHYYYMVLVNPISEVHEPYVSTVYHEVGTNLLMLPVEGLTYNTEYNVTVTPYRTAQGQNDSAGSAFTNSTKTRCSSKQFVLN